MELHLLDYIALGFYFILMVTLGYFTRRTKSFKEFAVGNHSVPAIMIFASLAATIVGPGFSVGVTSKSWDQGFLFYCLAATFSIQIIITGLFLAPRLAEHRDCNTIGEIMRKRYGRLTHLLAGILSVGLCVGFTAIMGKIGGGILHAITEWPIIYCIIAVTATTALLTFTGGIKATIATEGAQFSLIAIVIPVTLILGIGQSSLSMAELSSKASDLTSSAFDSLTGWQMFGIAISFMLGEVLIPPYANRALSAKSQAASKKGFLMAGGFVIIWLAIVAAFGIVAHGIVPGSTAPDDVFVTAGKLILPAGLFGLLLATLVAVIMSSQEACLNAAASSFVKDIWGIFSTPSEKNSLLLAKGITLILAALAIIFAQYSPSIIEGLLLLYAVWAPCMLVPLVGALYAKKLTPASGILSVLGGGIASWGWSFAGEPASIPAILIGLAVSIILFFIGNRIGSPIESTTQN